MVVAIIDNEEVNVGILGDFEEEQVMGEGGSESHPRVKKVGSPNPGCSHDAVVGHLHYREEFRAESIAGGKWHMRQGASCGKRVSKRVRSCASVRSWRRERMSTISFTMPWMWETSW